MLKGDEWTSDLFYTYYVPVIPNRLDEPDYDQAFYGWYNTYSGVEHLTVEAYYIGYDNQNTGPDADFSLHTLGARSVYFTAGIVEEEHGLFRVINQSR